MQTASLQSKGQKRLNWAVELKCENKKKMCKKQHQLVSRRELVDKVSLCCASLRACTVAPGSGTTTQLLVSSSRWSQKWKLNIVSVKQAKTNVELIWAKSLSWSPDLECFPADFSRNPTGDLLKSSWMMMWSWVMMWLRVSWRMSCL